VTALLFLVLSAAPLEVRVLERDVPSRVHLEAARITCDGKPLGGSSTFGMSVSIASGSNEKSAWGRVSNDVIAASPFLSAKSA